MDMLGHVQYPVAPRSGVSKGTDGEKGTDRELDSREARSKLQARGKPYFRTIERGLHVGYRKLKGKPGTWWARHYVGSGAYQIECLGPADDFSDADGTAILDFWQAQSKARERMV